jgi:hypothetical protein
MAAAALPPSTTPSWTWRRRNKMEYEEDLKELQNDALGG